MNPSFAVPHLTNIITSGLLIFTPFVNLPPRTLADYYALIEHPTSLKGLQKRVRGIQGRSAPTGITEFKSWDAFEKEVGHIWRNAREYNEDGSDMFNLAGEFEVGCMYTIDTVCLYLTCCRNTSKRY